MWDQMKTSLKKEEEMFHEVLKMNSQFAEATPGEHSSKYGTK